MARVEKRPISARTATITTSAKKAPKWQSLVSDLEDLDSDTLLVLAPDDGDSIRALKVQVARAAGSINRKDELHYAENDSGELEVWLRDKPKQRRGPRKPKE